MIKLLAVVSIVVHLTCSCCFGQPEFGLKAGYVENHIRQKNGPSYLDLESEPVASWNAGVFFKIRVTEKLNVIPELQFIKKGFDWHLRGNPYNTLKVSFSYLELPVLISYAPFEFRNLSLEIGLAFGMPLAVRAEGRDAKNFESLYSDSFEFGLIGGFGYSFLKQFAVSARYNSGWTNLAKNFQVDTDFRQYHRNFQLAFYYILPKKLKSTD